MSGMIAWAGRESCRKQVAEGLCRLAHRGSEVAGMAVLGEDGMELLKLKGTPADLKEKCAAMKSDGAVGIGECADALRCRAANITAVPAANNFFCAALDGTIDNFEELKRNLSTPFPVATDEDLLLALLCASGEPDRLQLLCDLYDRLNGAPGLAFIPADEAAVYCLAGENRFAVGIGEEGVCVASEMSALPADTKRCFWLEAGEGIRFTAARWAVYDMRRRKIKKNLRPFAVREQAENDAAPEEELCLLPLAVRETVSRFVAPTGLKKDALPVRRRIPEHACRAVVIAGGVQADIAAWAAQQMEQLCDLPCRLIPAGELRYRNACLDKTVWVIAVSHRGEEGDMLSAVRYAGQCGAHVTAVTANAASQLAALADDTVDTGGELTQAPLSLRAVFGTVLALSFLTLYAGFLRETVSELYVGVSLKMAEMLTGKISAAVKPSVRLNTLADRLNNSERLWVTGSGRDVCTAQTAARILRAVCRAPAAALPCSELQCETAGTLAGSDVLAYITDPQVLPPTLYCLRRMKLQGASVTIITAAALEEDIPDFDAVIPFSESLPLFNLLPALAVTEKAAVLAQRQQEAETQNQAG